MKHNNHKTQEARLPSMSYETARPTLLINDDYKSADLYIGGAQAMARMANGNIEASTTEELMLMFESYRDIFAVAAKHLADKITELKCEPQVH